MKKFLYWLVQLTWGGLLTIPGFILLFLLGIFNCPIYHNGYGYIVEVGKNWGGLNMGAVSFCGNYKKTNPSWYEHTRRHEFGHSIQNMMFGPLMIFLVVIPSVVRYWYQRIAQSHGKYFSPDWYDSVWFEGTATKWGTKWINRIENIPEL